MDAVVRAIAAAPNPAVAVGDRTAEAMSGATPYRTAGAKDGSVARSTTRTADNHRAARPAPSSFLTWSPVGVIRTVSTHRVRRTSPLPPVRVVMSATRRGTPGPVGSGQLLASP